MQRPGLCLYLLNWSLASVRMGKHKRPPPVRRLIEQLPHGLFCGWKVWSLSQRSPDGFSRSPYLHEGLEQHPPVRGLLLQKAPQADDELLRVAPAKARDAAALRLVIAILVEARGSLTGETCRAAWAEITNTAPCLLRRRGRRRQLRRVFVCGGTMPAKSLREGLEPK